MWQVGAAFSPSLCSMLLARGSLRAPSLPSGFTRNFGIRNSDRPLVPSWAPATRASTKWTMFAVRASRRPLPIGFLPAGRRRPLAIVERRAVAVARSIERRQHFGRKPAGLAQHRLEVIVAEVPIKPVGACASEPRRMLEGEDDILDRRPVGHDRCSPAPRSP